MRVQRAKIKSTCFSLKIGSKPTVGSSRIKSSGLWIKAAAKDTLLCWPPLISLIRRFSGGNWSNSERNFCLVSAKRHKKVSVIQIATATTLIETSFYQFRHLRGHWSCQSNKEHRSSWTRRRGKYPAAYNQLEVRESRSPDCRDFHPEPTPLRC